MLLHREPRRNVTAKAVGSHPGFCLQPLSHPTPAPVTHLLSKPSRWDWPFRVPGPSQQSRSVLTQRRRLRADRKWLKWENGSILPPLPPAPPEAGTLPPALRLGLPWWAGDNGQTDRGHIPLPQPQAAWERVIIAELTYCVPGMAPTFLCQWPIEPAEQPTGPGAFSISPSCTGLDNLSRIARSSHRVQKMP